MAPRKKSTQNKEFFEAILMLEKEKGIPADFLLEKVCNAIVTSVRKDYGGADVVFCDCNPEKYELRVYVKKTVVEEVQDEMTEITQEDAVKFKKNALVGDVVEHGGGSLCIVNNCFAGHPVDHEGCCIEHVCGLLEDVGAVLLYPQHLCCGVGGVKVQTSDFKDMLGINAGSDLCGLCLCAAVTPDDCGHQGVAFLVDGNDGVVDSVKADSADLCGVNAGGLSELSDHLLECMDPVSRILFSPCGEGVYGIVSSAGFSDKFTLGIYQEALHTLSTKVNTNNISHKDSPFRFLFPFISHRLLIE